MAPAASPVARWATSRLRRRSRCRPEKGPPPGSPRRLGDALEGAGTGRCFRAWVPSQARGRPGGGRDGQVLPGLGPLAGSGTPWRGPGRAGASGAPRPGSATRDTSLGGGVQRAGGKVTSSNGPSAPASVPPAGDPTAGGSSPVADREALPDRIWTLPNALSVLRLLGVPLFLWLLLGPEADNWAVVVLMVSGFTDWADGKLARWLDQSSRLGALLDPAADRLYIVSTLIALALREIVPLWIVVLLVGREVVLAVALLVLRHYGYPPLQVHYLGKAATLLLLYAFPGLMLADGDGWLARVLEPFAWALTIWGTALYVLAGVFYLIQVAGIVRAECAGRG